MTFDSCDASFLTGGGEMGKLIREMDWSATPLGPIGEWPQSLRTAVSICISSNFPISMAWGPEHVQIYNDGYWPICGGKHPDSMGQTFTECWASAMPVIGDAYRKALAGESQFIQNQQMFLDRHGYLEETFFTFSFSPIRDESGGVGGLFHPVNEVTGKMLAERRGRMLRDLSERTGSARTAGEAFALAAEALAEDDTDLPFVLIYLTDPDTGQARLAQAVGLAPGTPASPEAVRLDAADGAAWPLHEVMESGMAVDVSGFEDRFGALACGPYPEPPSHARILPVVPPGAETPRALIVAGTSARLAFDEEYAGFLRLLAAAVTAAVANAEALEHERRRAEALAEIDRAKTLFFSNVSHEFRTPITLMLGPLADMLSREDLDPGAREPLEMVQRNGRRLLKLVNSLLDFSRIEAGRAQASFEPMDLGALTADLASSFRSACENAGLELEVDCAPVEAYADRELWEKIVLNLLSNAFKFTLEGRISVTLAEEDGAAVLRVRDTGTGIPEAELPRIFDRFHRVAGSGGRSYEGSGIGLALAQEVAALHGGNISAESELGAGTCFTVRIPLGAKHLPQDRIGAAKSLQSTAVAAETYVEEAMRWLPEGGSAPRLTESAGPLPRPAAVPAEGDAPRVRILWADDNADMRDYVRRLLSPSYEVICAADGAAALEAARATPPDLVLSDVMMPKLDGFGLIAALRADPRLRTVPVILLSARAGEESRVEGLEAGASDYLVKPFSERELLARVEAQLKLARLRAEVARGEALSERILQSSQDGIQLLDLEGRILTGNGNGLGALQGGHPVPPVGERYACLWEGEHRDAAERAVAEALEGRPGRFTAERRDAAGTPGWWDELVSPIFGTDGQPERLLVISRDITESKLAEEKRQLLLHELNHRVKNTLAIVQSMAAQTLRGSGLDSASRSAFEMRLMSLAASHDLLTRQQWDAAALRDVVEGALQPFAAPPGAPPRFGIEGPDVRLEPNLVLSLGLGLHELATNASKYGALSVPGGFVAIRWGIEGGRLRFCWRETGGPPVSPPSRKGFGTRLIRTGLAHQFAAEVTMEFPVEGMVCEISLDLEALDV
ncbi:ATP-binding protein [Cribrihabitans neustonicus]|uniref:ATP-binding protein n=1 Tax=Cribrihabitans neustonicus TaxID=1429085 RepID=UPI003B5C8C74